MNASTRIKGKQLRLEVIPPGESEPVNYWADVTKAVLDNEGEFDETFDKVPAFFNVRWFLEVEAVQSTDPDSFWTFLFNHMNETVPFTYAPHGNPEPSADQPHFTGRAVVPNPPRLGGEAGDGVTYVFDSRLPIIDGPHRVTE